MSLSAATSRLHSASKNVRRISGKTEETGSLSGRSVWTRTMYTLGNADERKGNRRKWHRPPGSKRNTRVRTPRRKNRWNNATRMPEPLRDLFLFDIFSFPFLSFPFPFFFCLLSFLSGRCCARYVEHREKQGGFVRDPRGCAYSEKAARRSPPPPPAPSFAFSSEAFSLSREPAQCAAQGKRREREKKRNERERERGGE